MSIEDAKKRLAQLRKDQAELKEQLAELDTYLLKKYPKKQVPAARPSPGYTGPEPEVTSPPVRREYPYERRYREYEYEEPGKLDELKSLLLNNISNSRKLMEKFDYLLDALLSSMEEMSSEDVDKTIKLIAETQSHLLDAIMETREMLEFLEKKSVTKDELDKFIKEYKERYGELTNRLNEILAKMEEPATLEAVNNLQARVSQIYQELTETEELVKKGGKVGELSQNVKDLETKMTSLEERLKSINELVQSMREHVYAGQAAMSEIAGLENQINQTKQLIQTLQTAVLGEIGTQKEEVEKALKELEESAGQGKGLETKLETLEEKLEKAEEIGKRLDSLEKRIKKIEAFVDIYPIGEVHELSTLKSELNKIKPEFPAQYFSEIENRLNALDKKISQMQRERDSEKEFEKERLNEILNRLDKKLSEIESSKPSGIESKLGELESRINEIAGIRTEISQMRKSGDIEGIKSKLGELESRMLGLEQEITNLSKLTKEKPEMEEIREEISKLETMVTYLKEASLPKKEMQKTIQSLKEMIMDLQTRMAGIEKVQNKSELPEIQKELKNLESSISSIETRIQQEVLARVESKQNELVSRLINLERLGKMGLISDDAIKRELKSMKEKTKEMKEDLLEDRKKYKKLITTVSALEKEISKAEKMKKPINKVTEIRKRAEKIEITPKQRVGGLATRLFKARRQIQEKPRLTNKDKKELESILKSAKEVEALITHADLKRNAESINKELKTLISKVKKSPVKYAPELKKVEDKLLELKENMEKVEKDYLLISNIEKQIDENEKELRALSVKISRGEANPEDVRKKIEEIRKEVDRLKNRTNLETVKVHSIMKSLNDIKSKTDNLIPVAEINQALERAKAALGKKDIKTANQYLKKARKLAESGKPRKDILKKISELDSRLKKIGEQKAKATKRIEKKATHKPLFSQLFHSLFGLAGAHKKEIGKKVVVTKESIKKKREELEKLRKEVMALEKAKASPEKLKKAREELEELEKEVSLAKPKVVTVKKKEIKRAEKEVQKTKGELEKLKKIAKENKDKELEEYINRTWIKTILAQKRIALTKSDLDEIGKALKESQRLHEKRLKTARERIKKASLPLEFVIMDFIENMKPGEEITVSEMARAIHVNEKVLLDHLKNVRGKFKLVGHGILSGMLGKKPRVVRIEG